MHGVHGPYDTREDAIIAFNEAYAQPVIEYRNDFDGRHEYYILDGLPKQIGPTIEWGKDNIKYEPK